MPRLTFYPSGNPEYMRHTVSDARKIIRRAIRETNVSAVRETLVEAKEAHIVQRVLRGKRNIAESNAEERLHLLHVAAAGEGVPRDHAAERRLAEIVGIILRHDAGGGRTMGAATTEGSCGFPVNIAIKTGRWPVVVSLLAHQATCSIMPAKNVHPVSAAFLWELGLYDALLENPIFSEIACLGPAANWLVVLDYECGGDVAEEAAAWMCGRQDNHLVAATGGCAKGLLRQLVRLQTKKWWGDAATIYCTAAQKARRFVFHSGWTPPAAFGDVRRTLLCRQFLPQTVRLWPKDQTAWARALWWCIFQLAARAYRVQQRLRGHLPVLPGELWRIITSFALGIGWVECAFEQQQFYGLPCWTSEQMPRRRRAVPKCLKSSK